MKKNTAFWDEAMESFQQALLALDATNHILRDHGQGDVADIIEFNGKAMGSVVAITMPADARERLARSMEVKVEELRAQQLERLHEFGTSLGLSEEEMEALDTLAEVLSGRTTPESEEAFARA